MEDDERVKNIWNKVFPGREIPQGRIIILSTPRGSDTYYEMYKNREEIKWEKNKMAEHKKLGSINVVTDTETGQEKIGDVEAGFDDMALRKHIEKYGHETMLIALSDMIVKVVDTKNDINRDKQLEHDGYTKSGDSQM